MDFGDPATRGRRLVLHQELGRSTGHQTEEAFNCYVGVDKLKLDEEFMRKSVRRKAA